MKIGRDGSRIPMPMLANVMAPGLKSGGGEMISLVNWLIIPDATRMYGSDIRAFRLGASSSLLSTPGWRTRSWRPVEIAFYTSFA